MDKTLTDMLVSKENSVANLYNQQLFKIKDEVIGLQQ